VRKTARTFFTAAQEVIFNGLSMQNISPSIGLSISDSLFGMCGFAGAFISIHDL
jgi:hypothetical protein